ncbi:MAG: hypothetical protein Hyperionvirus8_24 [Hyperionvirus sp.]|uniref:Uncharacterized protein n=1 Tax=Hyperionvirus sp. TaxID=2487770 RepID=A0A3G5A8C7_9VIRU|nr:MAG: hypothetical protein Hyperionvirus8_24 [Hyperionvirus sp.]
MFYFIASKIWIAGDSETRMRNILLTGSICYIILHAFLYGGGCPESLARFRGYIYYLFVVDAILAGSYVWLFGRESKIESEEEEDEEENEEEHGFSRLRESGGKKAVNNSLPEVHRTLLELKAKNDLALKQDSSPFAKKDNGVTPAPPKSRSQPAKPPKLQVQTQEEVSQHKSVHSDEPSIPLYQEDIADTDIPIYTGL